MRYFTATDAVVAAISMSGVLASGACNGASEEIAGNWYCSEVDFIGFTNFNSSGTYDRVVDMSNGNCVFEPQDYSSPMGPLDEEVSLHFRGPINLMQLAIYQPGNTASTTKRDTKPSFHERRHTHGHYRKHEKEDEEKRDMVTATIDGKVVSWTNNYFGPAIPTANSVSESAASQTGSTASAATDPVVAPGEWDRVGYYGAESGTSEGLVMLNNNGGQGSGIFDEIFGASLSYAAASGTGAADGPQILANTMIPDNSEVIFFSDKPCKDDCGYTRPGSVAYHGFAGASKVILLEFEMPMTGGTGWDQDMPAIWLLNANIPRTQQYGGCSCWTSGCGEWDVFEVLNTGNTRATTTFHGKNSGGDSNFFNRPTSGTIKVAVIFNGDESTGSIRILNDDTTFDSVLSQDIVQSFCSTQDIESDLLSFVTLGE